MEPPIHPQPADSLDQRAQERSRERELRRLQQTARAMPRAAMQPSAPVNPREPTAPANAVDAPSESSSDHERMFAQQLRQEQAQALREVRAMDLRRGGGRRTMTAAQQRVTAEQSRRLSGRLQAAAASDANWPYWVVIAVSLVNDAFDIFGLNLLFGLDQLFDVMSLTIMLATRLFIRQSSGWMASKFAALAVEWVPFMGILPCWTIAALYVYGRALRERRAQRTAQERTQLEAMQASEMPAETSAEIPAAEEPRYAT